MSFANANCFACGKLAAKFSPPICKPILIGLLYWQGKNKSPKTSNVSKKGGFLLLFAYMIKVLTKSPKEYLKQGFSGCGAHSAKAILSAYGKDDKKDPYDYHTNLLAKYTGAPTTATTWVKVLKSYDIEAKFGNAKHLSDSERIKLLKNLLDKDVPVMLRIGNGYLPNGNYSNFTASFIGHWITLWGYNDEQKIFYVYDSCIPLN